MADLNKQKKSRSQRKKAYYAAQFAQTTKNKIRKKKRALEQIQYHIDKRMRRARRAGAEHA